MKTDTVLAATPQSRPWLLLLPPVAVALAVAGADVLQWLRAAPLWVDEEMIALNIRERGVAGLTGRLWLGQSAPLGWLLLQRAAFLALGGGELALRLLPLMFGIGTIAVAGWIAVRWLTPLGGALFVALCGLGASLSHYRFELKHYSADAFWGLLLPALAAWALENRHAEHRTRRWMIWWSAAAAGQFFANGALLVLPACAVVLALVIARRDGVRAMLQFGFIGAIWLLAFAVHYQVSLQYTHHNPYLRSYWSDHLPPVSATPLDRITWAGRRIDDLAFTPGGATLAAPLWLCAVAGFLMGRPPVLGMLFAVIPVTALTFAALGLVPLFERFAIYIVPALYAGLVLLLDGGIRWGMAAWRGRHYPVALAALAVGGMALWPAADVLAQGWRNLDLGAPGNVNRGVDDRSAVHWVTARRRPGDAIISTRLGWPALWWYGDLPVGRTPPGGRLPDGAVMYQVDHTPFGPPCRPDVEALFEKHDRALLHLGFPDQVPGFDRLLMEELLQFGRVVEFAEFASRSRVAVIERMTAEERRTAVLPPRPPGVTVPRGCILLRVPRRW